jgi:hypothetical protein
MIEFYATNNPALACIQVDNETFANSTVCGIFREDWYKDSTASYSEFCALGLEDLSKFEFTYYPNPAKTKIFIQNSNALQINSMKIYDVLGRLVLEKTGGFNEIDIAKLNSGVLFLNIETERGVLTKMLVKS